jgi:ATP-binding cassette subfamily C (CFTR/MRP) protein 1
MQIAVIMVLLARLVHWQPALAGVLTTVVLVPITAAITRKAAGVRKRLIGLTDERVKVCTEVVSGVRLVMPLSDATPVKRAVIRAWMP